MADYELSEAIEKLLEQGRASVGYQEVGGGRIPFVVIPADHKVESLEKFVFNDHQDKPDRIKQRVTVHDAESFIEYHTLFSDVNSRVFADETKNSVHGILDYHGAGSDGAPRWGQHRVQLVLRHSTEWQVWTGSNNKQKSQLEFAEFLEQYAVNIIKPDPAHMIEVAKDLQATTEVEFGSALRQNDGTVRWKYTETTTATVGAGTLQVPERFVVRIPVFVGGPSVDLDALLRYKIKDAKLLLSYTLIRPDEAARQGFLAIRNQIASTLQIKIVNGAPE